jgi:hypothetical protein
MEKKPRSLTVSESADYRPRIILKGAWLRSWGFTKGDKVSVNRTDAGEILIRFIAPGNLWSAMRRKYQHEYELVPAHKISRSRLRTIYRQVDAATEAHRRTIRARRGLSPRRA